VRQQRLGEMAALDLVVAQRLGKIVVQRGEVT
jgi:hypothetical protein